jgi:Cupin superfamily protein
MSINIEETKELFRKAKENKETLLLKNFMPDTPTWQEILNKAQERANTVSEFKPWQPEKEKMFGEIIVRNQFHMQALNFIPTPDAGETYEDTYMPTAAKNIKIVNEFMGQNCTYAFGLINPIGGESPTECHADPHDVVAWHCAGEIEWRISKSIDDPDPQIIILKPGDLFYLPKGTFHALYPKTPRASIIFNYNKEQ